ncbi:MAG TPA: alpha/beta hydrolase [Allosphingosinicella sp.]|nr:alpha/beta hydrolase [Allosphingosinicella sp.]
MDAPDGVRIFYRDEGEGRPILLLHGLMAHGGFFERQRSLAGAFRLIAVDLRGHGESRVGVAAAGVSDLAADIALLAERLDLRGAIGVGWSLGAAVLWRLLTGEASDRFAGAVIVDMSPRVLNADAWSLGLTAELCEARSEAIASDFRAFATGAGSAIFAQPLPESMRPLADWAGGEFARSDPAAIGAIWKSLVEEDSRPALPRIAQPTLVVRGAHSQLYGAATAEHLVAALPDARAVTFPASGHAPHLEEPERFNALIHEFAASLPPVLQPAI